MSTIEITLKVRKGIRWNHNETILTFIISRAMREPEFADRLLTDANKALAGYDLTAEEFAQIQGITRTEFVTLATEDRKSMGVTSSVVITLQGDR